MRAPDYSSATPRLILVSASEWPRLFATNLAERSF
jgi:hypothetical protein